MTSKKHFTFEEAQQKLADYCTYQDRCHQEVESKMYEFTLDADERDEVLIFLIQHNFLNEERFTRNFCRGKFNQKKWGKTKIKQELRKRKIPEKLIHEGFEEIDAEAYYQTFQNLAERKWELLNEQNHFVKKKKLMNFMQQKGYENELIYEFLNSKTTV